jgi:dipeptidyl aminopeptidase/acylaminoacyl peptidase
MTVLALARKAPRWVRYALAAAVLLMMAHVGGQTLLASAIAVAPNRGMKPMGSSPPPARLAAFALRELWTEVGPPRATLAAWVLEPHAEPAATVLILHGVRSHKGAMAHIASDLAGAGYRVVMVDLRGHGSSTGDFLTYGVQESRDLVQLLDHLSRAGLIAGKLAAYGFSYGGAAAIQLAARDTRIAAVVAVSTFASLREVVGDYARCYLPVVGAAIPDRWLQSAIDRAGDMAAFDPEQASTLTAARGLRAPVLLLHGSLDTQVPSRHGQALERSGGERAQLVLVAGETHGSIPADRSGTVRRETLAWYRRWLARDERQGGTPPNALVRTGYASPGAAW